VADDQIGSMVSPCSPRIIARTWVGGRFKELEISEQKREVSRTVPSPSTWEAGKPGLLDSKLGPMSTGLETTYDDRFFHPRTLEALENSEKERDVAVDEVEAGLVRFAAEPGG